MATGINVSLEGLDELMKDLELRAEVASKLPDIYVGVKAGVSYPDGTDVETVGYVHEFGSPSKNIPERSYLRSTLSQEDADYQKILKSILDETIQTGLAPLGKIDALGLKVEGDVKNTITTLSTPALSPETIKKKGSSNPLIDTGVLRKSVMYEIKQEDE